MAEEQSRHPLSDSEEERLTPDGLTPEEAGLAEPPGGAPAATGSYSASGKDPDDIQRDIRRTRAEMSETIDALSQRFEPDYLKRQARGALRSAARDTRRSMIDTIRDNPIPSLVAGLSIGWLLFSGSDDHDHEAYDRRYASARYDRGRYGPSYDRVYRRSAEAYPRRRYGDGSYYDEPAYNDTSANRDYAEGYGASAVDQTRAKASSAASTASDKADELRHRASRQASDLRARASDVADEASDYASDLADRGQYYGRRTTNWLSRQMDENPLGMGAVALAAGALVGLSVPETDYEHDLMGEQSDHLKRQAEQAAREKAEQAKRAAQATAEEAKAKAQDVAEHAKHEAKDVAETAKSEAKAKGLDEKPKAARKEKKAASKKSKAASKKSKAASGS